MRNEKRVERDGRSGEREAAAVGEGRGQRRGRRGARRACEDTPGSIAPTRVSRARGRSSRAPRRSNPEVFFTPKPTNHRENERRTTGNGLDAERDNTRIRAGFSAHLSCAARRGHPRFLRGPSTSPASCGSRSRGRSEWTSRLRLRGSVHLATRAESRAHHACGPCLRAPQVPPPHSLALHARRSQTPRSRPRRADSARTRVRRVRRRAQITIRSHSTVAMLKHFAFVLDWMLTHSSK